MFLCLVFLMLLRLFIAAFWSPAGGRGSDLLALVDDVYCVLLLSHVVSWVRCGVWVYRFLIFVVFLTMKVPFTPYLVD